MAKKKPAASSQPERLIRRSEADIRAYARSDAAKEDRSGCASTGVSHRPKI
jgi:hypothetical protein